MGQHLQMLGYIYKCETVDTFETDGTPYCLGGGQLVLGLNVRGDILPGETTYPPTLALRPLID